MQVYWKEPSPRAITAVGASNVSARQVDPISRHPPTHANKMVQTSVRMGHLTHCSGRRDSRSQSDRHESRLHHHAELGSVSATAAVEMDGLRVPGRPQSQSLRSRNFDAETTLTDEQ